MKKIYFFLFCFVFVFSYSPGFSQTVHVVTATNFAFTPVNTTANLGDTIRFNFGTPVPGGPPVNGGFLHTTTSMTIPTGAASWDDTLNADIPRHYSFDYVVTVPGVYNFKCTPHFVSRGMAGAVTVSGALPIKLVDFSAAELNGKAVLNWQTSSEQNSDHFSIQMSYDGLNFTDVGSTPAAGNSNAAIKYSYSIGNIVANTPYVYFRLLTIDKDTKQQYSDIVLLHFGKAVDNGLIKSFYPNPAENGDHLFFGFNADADSKIQLTIYDPSGRKLYAIQATANRGVNQSHFPLPKLRKGAYFVQFVLGDRKQTMPLFIK